LLAAGIAFDHWLKPVFFTEYVRLAWYAAAYFPVGVPVLREIVRTWRHMEIFTEYTLMTAATVGAFFIREYPEGVAVMLFYAIGELFQDRAVTKAKRNIKALLDIRPAVACAFRNNRYETVDPATVAVGETVQVKAGEKAPLDGELLTAAGSFNTAALTGESKPKTIRKGGQVLAGMLSMDKVVELKVTRRYADSSLSKILDMVQNASSRKAKTELLIRRLAKVYTPLVFLMAMAVTAMPLLVLGDSYVFAEWFYRGLIFLVISCPCALVISIPLGYFGGIGAASRHGILFKGSNFLDIITRVNTVVMDKTGTLTQGVFKVQDVVTEQCGTAEFLNTIAAIEQNSTHPIAQAVAEYAADHLPAGENRYSASGVEELPGYGLKGMVNGRQTLAGNTTLLRKHSIPYTAALDDVAESVVAVAINNRYAGYLTIADELKDDAAQAVAALYQNGVTDIWMLSGDKDSITQKTAQQLKIRTAFGNLLPEDKLQKVEALKRDATRVVAFVGDGINDAPVLALSDVGIAMGALGSDAAIETADVVIQTDHPSKIAVAIQIGKATKNIVMQNIVLALSIKAVILCMGAAGFVSMWGAVFADVGVALLAILNAIRIMQKKF
jgi:Cd2+/Zn2+-exporting ATPase